MADTNAVMVVDAPAKRGSGNQYPASLTKQKQRDFLDALSQTGRHVQSCAVAGIVQSVPYQWASSNKEFAKRFEAAKAKGEKVLLDSYEDLIDNRTAKGQSDPQSAVLTMFRTKRLDPRYRDNAVVQVNAVGPVAIQLNFGGSGVQPLDSSGGAGPQLGETPA
jgi:hypothetical protein